MAKRIQIILEEDFDGGESSRPTTLERVYELPEGSESLSEIEAALEELRLAALPKLEAELLTLAQRRFVAREKGGRRWRCDGKRTVTLKTLHGSFAFRVQQLREVGAAGTEGGGEETTYPALTEKSSEGSVSPRLAGFCCYYSNRMSYEEVARLVERMTGQRSLLSDRSIRRSVIGKAASVSERWVAEVVAGEAREEEAPPAPFVVQEEADFYDAQAEEILLMADAIQVKRQKAAQRCGQQQVPKQEKRARVSTDARLLNAGARERSTASGSIARSRCRSW